MKTQALLLACLAYLNQCQARTVVLPGPESSIEDRAAAVIGGGISMVHRALPDSPSGGYAPANVSCPSTRPTIREAGSLSANETAWLSIRRNNTIAPMISLLSRANISGFDASAYIMAIANNATALPNIGIAVSGGGYRALMNGAGFLAAADNRTTNSTNSGQIGGLLQATTYLAGLSGGGWLVGSIYANNFSTVQALRDGSNTSSVWQFGNSIFEGPASSGIQLLSSVEYFNDIDDQVGEKNDAGYNTTITDYWGRALSYQLVNATDGGPSLTFSSISEQDFFTSGNTPMPVLVSDSRSINSVIVALNSTLFEFNPFEMGSWDPTTYAFAPMRYVGSKFDGGVIPSSQSCVRGFDQIGFIMGTSSTLFNQFLLSFNSSGITLPTVVTNILTSILKEIGEDNDDISDWTPNPFYHFNNATNRNAQDKQLTLVDGGEDGQNIPLNPLIQPQRAVDIIFAIDSSFDTTYGWPNGTSLVATYERSRNATIENGTSFPSIPDQNTFVNLGLNTRPTFFGCNATNTTDLAPLVVYIPNAPYITQSNVSTFDPDYNNTQRNLIIQNGYDVATMGNGTLDSQWSTCVACAVLSRSFHKTGTTVPAACTACFTKYCWNGTISSQAPPVYNPTFLVGEIKSAGTSLHSSLIGALVVCSLATFLVL